MIKKSQFALVFLTVCAMLAVWFIKSPISASTDEPNDDVIDTNTGRLSGIQDLIDAKSESRNKTIATYNSIIASATASLDEKEAANLNIKELNEITELEAIMEVSIINLGYVDCFVHYSTNTVEVVVASSELTAQQAVDIIEVINNNLTDLDAEVIVQYKTVDSLK